MSKASTGSGQIESKISVIIPTYNEEKVITQLLTVLTCDPSLEIIVCDGGSQDATRLICESFPVKFIGTSLGRGTQQNAGASLAKSNILVFLHADSLLEEQVFSDIRSAVELGKLWGCCTMRFDNDKIFFKCLAWASNQRAKVFSVCFGDQGIFCTKEFFLAEGGFPYCEIMEDLSLSKQLRRVSRAEVISGKIVTSARRFTERGPWKTLFKIQVLKLLFSIGVSTDKLAFMYRRGFWLGLWKRQ